MFQRCGYCDCWEYEFKNKSQVYAIPATVESGLTSNSLRDMPSRRLTSLFMESNRKLGNTSSRKSPHDLGEDMRS